MGVLLGSEPQAALSVRAPHTGTQVFGVTQGLGCEGDQEVPSLLVSPAPHRLI